MKKEEKYLNCSNCSNDKFTMTGTALKDFYNTMFNVNIKDLYQKKQPNALPIITNNRYTDTVLKFIIIIEDNNKKIFKHRVLKIKFRVNCAEIDKCYKNISNHFWDDVDRVVFKYCKKYLYKMNSMEYMQFVNKYYDFQYNYKEKEDIESI